ncbi:MAG: Branched-chain amino acid transporter, amino acid-binding protein [Myxococcaceae bacterium]|nr:Branched-chain amino acid transporter, amino acid-binding protein [Myxococcaceae bacterium]
MPSKRPIFARRFRASSALRAVCGAGAIGAGVLFALSTLTASEGCADKAPAPSAATPIIIGVSLGLTGENEGFAAPLRDAVRVAEGQINAGGGLLGRPVRFDVRDDQSDETTIVTDVAHQLVNEGAVAIIGPLGSQQVVLTQKIYADREIIQISPSATSTDLSTIQPSENRFLFRTTPADDFQGAAVILLAQKTPLGLGDAGAPLTDGGLPVTCNRLAIVNIDNSYGNAMADVIRTNFPKRGVGRSIVIQQKLGVDVAATYATEAAALVAAKPDCSAVISYAKVAAQYVHDVKADPGYKALSDKNFFFIGTDGVYTPDFIKLSLQNQSDETSPSTADGVFGTNPDTNPGTKEYNEFKTIYRSYFPALPDAPAFAANTYDAAILIALAIQQAGSATDHLAIRDALPKVASGGKPFTPAQVGEALLAIRQGQDVDYKGASGNVDFDPNGNVRSGFIVWEAFRNPMTKKVEYRTAAQFTTEELQDQIK